MRALIAAAAMLAAAGAQAQTYQVGQYLGNLNDAGRLAYNTMGSAAQHGSYGAGGATWSNLGGQNAARMAGTASATIGGRTVPLTLISRVPVPALANAVRGVVSLSPAGAAVTLLGFAAMNNWLAVPGMEWNKDPATQAEKPFIVPVDTQAMWYRPTQYGGGWAMGRDAACAGMASWLKTAEASSIDAGSEVTYTPQVIGTSCRVVRKIVSFWWGTSTNNYDSGLEERMGGGPDAEPIRLTLDQGIERLHSEAYHQGRNYDAVDWKSITEGLLKAGGSVNPSQITSTVSGPASQPGQKTTTTGTNAAGQPTTTTTSTTHNYTYNNNNVTHNSVTTTTTINNVTNQVENQTTEETENEKPDETANDSPLPGLPELYERKYPDGIVGVWTASRQRLGESPMFSIIPSLTPNVGDGGCPVWTVALDVGVIDFGQFDVSVPCWVWAFVRLAMIVTALFLARRLVFGG